MHYLEVLNISENIFRKFAEYCLALKKSVATPLLLAGGTCSRYGLSIMKRAEKPLRAQITFLGKFGLPPSRKNSLSALADSELSRLHSFGMASQPHSCNLVALCG